MPSTQHVKSNREELFAYIFSLYWTAGKIRTHLAFINMSYVKFVYLLALAESNSDATKPTLRLKMLFQNDPPSFFKFFKNLSPFLCHFVTYNREYYKLLCRFRHHIPVDRLQVQSAWLGLVTQSVIGGSMWPTC